MIDGDKDIDNDIVKAFRKSKEQTQIILKGFTDIV